MRSVLRCRDEEKWIGFRVRDERRYKVGLADNDRTPVAWSIYSVGGGLQGGSSSYRFLS